MRCDSPGQAREIRAYRTRVPLLDTATALKAGVTFPSNARRLKDTEIKFLPSSKGVAGDTLYPNASNHIRSFTEGTERYVS
jgi:hypothetical protein